MRTPTLLLAALALGLAPSHADAHQFWLSPSVYAVPPGQSVVVTARAGVGFHGAPKPWAPDRSVRFVLLASRLVDLEGLGFPGDEAWARFAPSDRLGAMLAFESTFTPIQLPAKEFDAYLEDEGLTNSLTARGTTDHPGRERFRRCAKTWLSGTDASRATKPLGLSLEVVPRSIPGQDSLLAVVVLRGGQPLPGALVKAWRAPLDPSGRAMDAATRDPVAVAWQGRTGPDGSVRVPVAESGEWLVSLVDMVPSAEPSEADWESTWASLTFARP